MGYGILNATLYPSSRKTVRFFATVSDPLTRIGKRYKLVSTWSTDAEYRP